MIRALTPAERKDEAYQATLDLGRAEHRRRAEAETGEHPACPHVDTIEISDEARARLACEQVGPPSFAHGGAHVAMNQTAVLWIEVAFWLVLGAAFAGSVYAIYRLFLLLGVFAVWLLHL